MENKSIDAVGIVPGTNLFYLTGIRIKQSERLTFILILKNGETFALVPEVELDKFETIFAENIFSYKDESGPEEALKKLRKRLSEKSSVVSVEYSNCRVMEYRVFESLGKEIKNADDMVNKLRVSKTKEENDDLRSAVQVLEESFEAIIPIVKPGVKEIEIAAQLEYEMKKRGSTGTPFETIVASGYRGASPHGRASNKKIKGSELVVIDFGSTVNGYVGDICRTIAVGETGKEEKKVYEIVREAQESAINLVKPGITAHEVDEAARKVINTHGYGEYFTHRTGHGLGLNSHEKPYIMQDNKTVLEPGMVFSIEPGIYLPDKFGVRIEDNIVVTEDGSENLMKLSTNLIEN